MDWTHIQPVSGWMITTPPVPVQISTSDWSHVQKKYLQHWLNVHYGSFCVKSVQHQWLSALNETTEKLFTESRDASIVSLPVTLRIRDRVPSSTASLYTWQTFLPSSLTAWAPQTYFPFSSPGCACNMPMGRQVDLKASRREMKQIIVFGQNETFSHAAASST